MSDIVERLRIYATDDHERGCQGRCYDCSCGYDDKRDPLLKEAAAEIERLRAALEPFAGALEGNWSHQPDSLPIVAGYGAHDLRLRFTLGDFRRARTALTAQFAEGEK
jgi:hypothetical protein